MNNAINEIKNTLEGTNSRTTEAEDRTSEVTLEIITLQVFERSHQKTMCHIILLGIVDILKIMRKEPQEQPELSIADLD